MTNITGVDTYFTNIEGGITRTQWESIIDQGIDKINGYSKENVVPNMSGAAGSKTLAVNSMQAGFIRSLAVAIYSKDYKGAGAQAQSFSLGGLSSSQSNSSGGGAGVEELARAAAEALSERDWSRSII